jgi:hypothetical protein
LGSALATDSRLRRLPLNGKARGADGARNDQPGSDGVAPWRRRPISPIKGYNNGFGPALIPRFPFGSLLRPSWYRRDWKQEDAVLAASHVPSNVVVEAASDGEFTFPTIAGQIARVKLLKEHGYVAVYSVGGYLVMHKPGIKR